MTARTYRKTPVEIQAIEFTGDNVAEIQEFTTDPELPPPLFRVASEFRAHGFPVEPGIDAAVFDKKHSTWVGVKTGQWVLRGLDGEFYPCEADVFTRTYDAVDETTPSAEDVQDQVQKLLRTTSFGISGWSQNVRTMAQKLEEGSPVHVLAVEMTDQMEVVADELRKLGAE